MKALRKYIDESILDSDKQVASKIEYTLLARDPDYFAQNYLKCRESGYSVYERDGVKYLSVFSCGVKEIVIDQCFPYMLLFKIRSISAPVKIVVKDWNRFVENFKSPFSPSIDKIKLGEYLSKYTTANVRVYLQDPEARYDTQSFDHFDICGQLVFEKAKSINLSILPKVKGDIIFYKKNIGVLNIPFMNDVRSVTIKGS